MGKLVMIKEDKPSRLKIAILLYQYLHCWRLIKESFLGKKINKHV